MSFSYLLDRIRMAADYALSIKQPWAALLVQGVKTIEIRRWMTARRGQVYIHAARVPDPRPEGWALLSARTKDMAELRGGLIGVAQLVNCKTYRDATSFAEDQKLHRNDPAWFEEQGLYGFVFEGAKPLPFRRYPGWVRFFQVSAPPKRAVTPPESAS
jgi:hypothetical protein